MFCYIHIPFCESKCKYCRFASFWWIDDFLKKKYVQKLINDIESFDKKNEKLESIYFWWWTPTSISDNDIWGIINSLDRKFWFKNAIEISLETTPKFINSNRLKIFSELWINRLSLWIQSLNDKALKEIWRNSRDVIISSLDVLERQKYIENISLDFIIWLPFVKIWWVKKDIQFVLNNYNFVKHISVYMLEDYYQSKDKNKNLKINKKEKFENIYYPDSWGNLWIREEDYLREYLGIKDYLQKNWYYRYEISNYSMNWFECKHNNAYWEHKDYLWFWLGSHSFINGFRYSTKDDFDWYYKWEFSHEEKLSENDKFLERVMFWLRTNWLEKDIYEKLDKNSLERYILEWYLQKSGNKIILADKSVTILDYLIADLH